MIKWGCAVARELRAGSWGGAGLGNGVGKERRRKKEVAWGRSRQLAYKKWCGCHISKLIGPVHRHISKVNTNITDWTESRQSGANIEFQCIKWQNFSFKGKNEIESEFLGALQKKKPKLKERSEQVNQNYPYLVERTCALIYDQQIFGDLQHQTKFSANWTSKLSTQVYINIPYNVNELLAITISGNE